MSTLGWVAAGTLLIGVCLCRLPHAPSLCDTDLSGQSLPHQSWAHAKISGADLRYTDLHESDLRGADLSNCCAVGADLRGVDLRGADLHSVNLERADLRGARLDGAIIYCARYDHTTRWPAGFTPSRFGGRPLQRGCALYTFDHRLAPDVLPPAFETAEVPRPAPVPRGGSTR